MSFIDSNLHSDSSKRENIILYNPAKGLNFTKKIIASLPDYEFIALKGFNREKLKEVFSKAKIYIDFGNFPGKDRLPREAVLNGCCIVTGKLGASFFYEDLPIPYDCKFDVKDNVIPQISNKIKEIINNYDDNYLNYTFYVDTILKEQEKFYNEIDNFFLK